MVKIEALSQQCRGNTTGMEASNFVTYRDENDWYTVASPHPVQAKIIQQNGRWHLFLSSVERKNGEGWTKWRKHPHPFPTKGEAELAAFGILPDCLAEYRSSYYGANQLTYDGTMTREQALEVMGLSPESSRDEIRKKFRTLSLAVHPDTGGSTFLFNQINAAMDILINR